MASPKGYICEVDDKGNAGFIESPIVFMVDHQKNQVMISDPIILWVNERPLASNLKTLPEGKQRIRWQVRGIPTLQDKRNAFYTAELDKVGKNVRVTGRLQGAANRMRGTGPCRNLTQDELKNLLRS